MSKIIEILKKKARNVLEVEDILGLVRYGDKTLIGDLQKLKIINPEVEVNHAIVPFDNWIDIVCEFFDKGYDRLVEIANTNELLSNFVIGVLEETKSEMGFSSVLSILKNSALKSKSGYEKALKCIEAINNMISFDDLVKINEKEASEARILIHNFISYSSKNLKSESDLVISYCALRNIGNFESVKLIKQLKPFVKPENVGVDSLIILLFSDYFSSSYDSFQPVRKFWSG